LSGLTYLKIIDKAKLNDFVVTLFFVNLESAEIAIERVTIRVKKGGHSIPKDVIERRYKKGLANFPKYASVVQNWYLLDNSGQEYQIIAKSINEIKEILNFTLYKKIITDESC
jgi:predicted ABC-type ATPase